MKQSEINAKAAKAADKDIHTSSVPNEIKLMVQMANGTMAVVEDVFSRVKGIYARHSARMKTSRISFGSMAHGINYCLRCWWYAQGKCVKPENGYCKITRSK